jgi:L-asparaginase
MTKTTKTRLAHLTGPTATIQNTPPLVTSNKARTKHGLPALKDVDGAPLKHDALRSQRLAVPAKVYVEQFSAHPLESDAAERTSGKDADLADAGAAGAGPRHPRPQDHRIAGARLR